MRIAVVVFPGSNADWDALHAMRDVLGADARFVWHKETSIGAADAVVLPGGFSYGDYLRCGAIARFSPVAPAVVEHARRGTPVLGICNGFQVLTELGLLPGALTRNASLRFVCRDVHVRVEADGAWTRAAPIGSVLRLPVAHAEGRYQADAETLRRLEGAGLVALRYCAADGTVGDLHNPNGSRASIAGIYGEKRNVMGLMPHPERASELVLGSADGLAILRSVTLPSHARPPGRSEVAS